MDVGGHLTSSGHQIWTLMDVPGRSGNTLKVPGSRPGRPTKIPERLRSRTPTVVTLTSWKEINGSGPPIRVTTPKKPSRFIISKRANFCGQVTKKKWYPSLPQD